MLISPIESLEKSDTQEEPDEKEIVPSGPSLKLLSVNREHRVRSRMIDVVAHLSNVEDKDDVHEAKVLSISSEIAKSQAIAREHIDSEIRTALKSRVINNIVLDELTEAVIQCLEKKGIVIDCR